MADQTLYKECPLCTEGEVKGGTVFCCNQCGLTLQEKSVLGLFKKGRYTITNFGSQKYKLAQQALENVVLPPDPLKITIGNVYPDHTLAEIANGDLSLIRPVRTILARIILEQLREECFVQVTELRRGHGSPLADQASYLPQDNVPPKMDWQDEGNLFCTTNRLVFPSNRFTFIRMDRKIVAVRAFQNGVAVQRKGEEYATYFVGCHAHEAALVVAYVIAKVPLLREKMTQALSPTE